MEYYYFSAPAEYVEYAESGYISDGEYSNGTINSGPTYPMYCFHLCECCYPTVPVCPLAYEPYFYDVEQSSFNDESATNAPVSSGRNLIKWNLPPPPTASFHLFNWKPMPYGLETFWQSAFGWFFRPFWTSFNHIWTFEPTEIPPTTTDVRWQTASYSAKVRFQCPLKHGWTSLKGRVVFWFRIICYGNQIVGQVFFKLYGQKCHQCSFLHPEIDYLPPLWYPEEIENAIRQLHIEVSKQCYGVVDQLNTCLPRIRQGKPRKLQGGHHVPAHCQACHEGLCVLSGFK